MHKIARGEESALLSNESALFDHSHPALFWKKCEHYILPHAKFKSHSGKHFIKKGFNKHFFLLCFMINNLCQKKLGWLVAGFKSSCHARDLELLVECPPWGVFLRDPNPYLREFRRKLRKTPNSYVVKRIRGLNPKPPVYQLRAQNRSVTGGAELIRRVSDDGSTYLLNFVGQWKTKKLKLFLKQ